MADRRLQVFHAVSKMMSFTKAAQLLKMTQPAVTFQIRQLEDYLNVRLFDRSHNKIDLTQAGKKVFHYSEKIFALYNEMESSIREVTKQVGGPLNIGACHTFAEYFMPELIANFKQQHPDVNVRLKVSDSNNVTSLVENSFVDIGIVDSNIESKTLTSTTCFQDEWVLVVPNNHALAGTSQAQVRTLADASWIISEKESANNNCLFNYFSQNGLIPDNLNISMELGSIEAIKGAIEAGSGISILPRAAVQKEIRLGTLSTVSLSPALNRPFVIIYKEQKYPLKVLNELISFSKEHFKPVVSADMQTLRASCG